MEETITTRLAQLLRSVDMEVTTEKQLRKTLEQELDMDLSGHKQLIRGEIEKFFDSQQQAEAGNGELDVKNEEDADYEEEEEEAQDEPKAGKKRKGRGFGSSILSEPLAAFMGTEAAPRNEVVKRIWQHIREFGLQDPNNKRKIIPDEVLGTFLTAPVNMMTMNKQLSKHCFSKDRFNAEEGHDDDADSDRARAKPKPRAKKVKLDADGNEKKSRPQKPVRTTDEMANWIGGQGIMSRPQITSFFWAYIKSEGLLNPNDKREVLCNDVLKNLTGKDRFLAFGGQKHFGHHILK